MIRKEEKFTTHCVVRTWEVIENGGREQIENNLFTTH